MKYRLQKLAIDASHSPQSGKFVSAESVDDVLIAFDCRVAKSRVAAVMVDQPSDVWERQIMQIQSGNAAIRITTRHKNERFRVMFPKKVLASEEVPWTVRKNRPPLVTFRRLERRRELLLRLLLIGRWRHILMYACTTYLIYDFAGFLVPLN